MVDAYAANGTEVGPDPVVAHFTVARRLGSFHARGCQMPCGEWGGGGVVIGVVAEEGGFRIEEYVVF